MDSRGGILIYRDYMVNSNSDYNSRAIGGR
jgi:hypothetical protein